jgi:sugar phosphate isomerase/epimerase
MPVNDLVLAPTTIPDASPLAYVRAGAAAGFRHIGLRLNRSPGLPFHEVVGDRALIAAMKRELQQHGIQVVDIYSFYLQPQTKVADFAPALEHGADFGARYAVVMGADTDWSRTRDNFGAICELADGFNLVCTLEPAVIRPLANLQQSLKLIADAGRSNAAVCVDPLNFARAGDRIADLKQVDPRYLPYAQITDGIIGPDEPNPALLGRMGPNRRSLLGQGNVPLREILAALPAGIPLSIETPPPAGSTHSADEWAKIVMANTRDFLAGG